ncbi:MAG: 3-oxoacyl-[acyl-carrier protein] reductase [Kiritimatiellia bacterium]|jgi:3-oxoacyl-[acyl-carrier protein] reductase
MKQDELKLAIVTGAAGVLGEAITRDLLRDHYRVVLLDVEADRLETLAQELGDAAIPRVCDIRDSHAVSVVVAELEQDFCGVSVLVNNAGVLSNDKLESSSDEEWRRILSINLDGAFYLSRACLPGMKARGWGRIVNMCSLAMKIGGLTAGTAYTTSKGAMAALTLSVARETTGFGVTVNGIAPAYVRTPMVMNQLTEAQRTALLQQIPVGRFCEPEEVAHVVNFLVSPLAGFITGEIVDINGGLEMG